jgi:hypothetical protein
MLGQSAIDQLARSVRARLATGSGFDELLTQLRLDGIGKVDSMRVIQEATGVRRH